MRSPDAAASYTFVLPRTFQPMESLPPKLWTRADDCRFLMSGILRKTANRDVDPWGCVRLHQTVLRRIMAPNCISGIVKALEAGGVIQTAPYHPGVKCRGYKLTGPVLGDRCVTVPATDPRLIERIKAERERLKRDEQRQRWKPIHYMLEGEQRTLTGVRNNANTGYGEKEGCQGPGSSSSAMSKAVCRCLNSSTDLRTKPAPNAPSGLKGWLSSDMSYGRPEADYLRDGIHELRVGRQATNYRILYFFHAKTAAVLSHGLVKAWRVPRKEIELAVKRKSEFEREPRAHSFEEG